MKIRAIRLREVGCFSSAVAVEGFSGGLDVLAGPNELGKSTLFKALRLVLSEKHSANNKTIASLKPYAGGAPLIEVDFEADGKLWRIRKQFLSDRQAVLSEMAAGQVVARGEDAHARVLALLGDDGAARHSGFDLIFVGQKQALTPQAPALDARLVIERAMAGEIAAATGGAGARALRAKIAGELASLITATTRKPKAGGVYAEAIRMHDDVRVRFETAKASAEQASARLDQLGFWRDEHVALSSPAAASERERRCLDARSALDQALAARQRLVLIEADLKGKESMLAECRARHAGLRRGIEELGRLEAVAAVTAADVETQTGEIEQREQNLAVLRGRSSSLKADLARAQQQLQAHRDAERRREAELRRGELSLRLSKATEASSDVKRLAQSALTLRVTPALLGAAETEARAITTYEARLSAALPKVHIDYASGGEGKMRLDGRKLAHGETIEPDRRLVFVIEGVGSISVEPGAVEGRDDMAADLAAHQAQLAALLEQARAAGLGQLRAAMTGRLEFEAALARARDQLAVLAPKGIAALSAEMDALGPAVPSDSPDLQPGDIGDRATIIATIDSRELALSKSAAEDDAATRDVQARRERLAGVKGEAENRRLRIAQLAGELPGADERVAVREALAGEVAAFEAGVHEALRERRAFAEAAPDAARLATLEEAVRDAEAAKRAADDKRARLERDLAVLERDLERDRHDGVEQRARELATELVQAEVRLNAQQDEVQALSLLQELLDEAEAGARTRFQEPVLRRLQPYLEVVFPGARIALGRDLGITGLTRQSQAQTPGQAETLLNLSDGTQEQIAVLARLGLGRLLADTGRAVPVILDDALVYSDDARMERLFEALRLAAAAHQVVVLTCRARAFEPLGGTVLRLTPWAVT